MTQSARPFVAVIVALLFLCQHKSVGSVVVEDTAIDSVNISVGRGWNLISLCLLVTDSRPSSVFPTAVSPAYSYETGYQIADSLKPGQAYWLKFDSAEVVTIVGSPFVEFSVGLHVGWNLVGSTSYPITLDQLDSDPCASNVSSQLYAFVPGIGYAQTDTILPGHGVWIKFTGGGTLYEKKWVKVTDLPISTLWTSPTEPNILWGAITSDVSEGTTGAILRSTNWGLDWDTLLAGVDARGSIVSDPDNPNILYVGLGGVSTCSPGITKTTDGGISWFRADAGIVEHLNCDSWVYVNLVDPNNTNILYATAGGILLANRFYKSVDGGLHWDALLIHAAVNCVLDTLLQSRPLTPAIDPQNSNVIFAGTQLDTVLYWTTDGGDSWDVRHCFFNGRDILSVHVDATDSNTVFVAAYGFFRSKDRGESWESLNNGIVDVSGGLEFFPTSDANVIYATTPGCVYRTENQGLDWVLMKCDPLIQIPERLDQAGKFIYVSNDGGIYRMRICTASPN
jgi:photosystem II stability/assembly factor-like uncharacterized protein